MCHDASSFPRCLSPLAAPPYEIRRIGVPDGIGVPDVLEATADWALEGVVRRKSSSGEVSVGDVHWSCIVIRCGAEQSFAAASRLWSYGKRIDGADIRPAFVFLNNFVSLS